jgi:hypothetical protein
MTPRAETKGTVAMFVRCGLLGLIAAEEGAPH